MKPIVLSRRGFTGSLLAASGSASVEAIVHAFHRGFLVAAVVAGLAAYTARRIPRVQLWESSVASGAKQG